MCAKHGTRAPARQHMVPRGVYRREIEASRVRQLIAARREKERSFVASRGRERRLTFDDSH